MKLQFTAPSSDKIHTLKGVVYLPDCETKGFFHIVHGMTEHIARYDKIMTALCEEGYISFGYDNLGHGGTARDDSELGFIASKNGDDLLARDVKAFSDAVMDTYGSGREYPYYLMGHSMGSFITRVAVEKYVHPDKYIIMGTSGSNPAAGAGLALIAAIKKLKGERYISKTIDNIAFGSYNERFGGGTEEDPSPWLTNDENERKKYYADKFCTFKFTVSAMGDLIRLIKTANRPDWYKNVRKDMPILILSGENDPVGAYGDGVREVADGLVTTGHNARAILYKGACHEILNDFTYPKVRDDILAFLGE